MLGAAGKNVLASTALAMFPVEMSSSARIVVFSWTRSRERIAVPAMHNFMVHVVSNAYLYILVTMMLFA